MSDVSSHPTSPVPPAVPQHGAAPRFEPLPVDFDDLGSASTGLFMAQPGDINNDDNDETRTGLSSKVHSMVSKNTDSSYEILEDDDYADDAPPSPSPTLFSARGRGIGDGLVVQRQRERENATASVRKDVARAESNQSHKRAVITTPLVVPRPMRAASTRDTKMRHPTPDLQTLQGAYSANVEQLEKSAEKLSMTSSIEDAIRQMHQEQKRADSRRSSLLSSPIEAPLARQLSNVNTSIIDTNNTARSGGYSPGGYNMISPHHSISGSRARSSSKGSKFGRQEPDLEGRPLDSFVLPSLASNSPIMSRSASIAEQDEDSSTMTKAVIDPTYGIPVPTRAVPRPYEHSSEQNQDERPGTSASTNTLEQAQDMFRDFDGEHYTPGARGDVIGSRPRNLSGSNTSGARGGEALGSRSRNISSEMRPGMNDGRVSSQLNANNRMSTARPNTYADPTTGQQMVFYPAPVPMMLNLPQKLSKRPASTILEKRRTQVLSTLPPAVRQSAVWLPDVLEDDGNEHLHPDHPMQSHEYMKQHQRQNSGSRRNNTDSEHIAPQLRANAFFEQPGISEKITVKEESAVATLDSILDASAYAPVNAFTDHAFAGSLGAEVYGPARDKRISTMPDKTLTKRRSSSTLLLSGRRSSSGNLLGEDGQEKRRSTMSNLLGYKKFDSNKDMTDEEIPGIAMQPRQQTVFDGEESDHELEGQFEDEVFQGPPTTLLAELQLRKQQQKQRVKPQISLNGMRTTFMEREAIAAIENRNRKKGRVNLAWEDPNQVALESHLSDDEDIPLGVLYQSAQEKKKAVYDPMRPMGLMELRDMEDNEPLSRRRDRITGRIPPQKQNMRASTMTLPLAKPMDYAVDSNEMAVQDDKTSFMGPSSALRPVSGDFASEMMSQLGIEDAETAKRNSKGKGKEVESSTAPVAEEEETLGQRRKRLQAEKEAREREVSGSGGPRPSAVPAIDSTRPVLSTRRSMADILQVHPAANGTRNPTQGSRVGSSGLLGMHEQHKTVRASTMVGLSMEAAASRENVKPQREHAHRVYSGQQQQQYPVQRQYAPQPVHGMPMQNGYGMPGLQHPVYGASGENLGNYSQQQLMMPNVYGRQPGHATQSMYGQPALHGGGGLYSANNPMAQSMLQLQMQMDQMSSVLAERQLTMGDGRVDMVERWREGVSQ